MPRPGLISARNHWCLHDDQLAAQYDGILNLTETFPGCAKAPAGASFYAPLRRNAAELVGRYPGAGARETEAWYWTGNSYALAGVDVERFEPKGLLLEPASTNKNLNYNANPDPGLTGLLTSGDPNLVITRVQDAQRLSNAGLGVICPSGYVIDVDNSAGSGSALCYIDGPNGNSNTHAWSMFARSLGGLCRVQSTNGEQVVEVTATEEYERFSVVGANTISSAYLAFYVAAGAHGRFILNQLEELTAPSSPLVTEGASTSRAADQSLQYDGADLFIPGQELTFLCEAHFTAYNNAAMRPLGTVNSSLLWLGDSPPWVPCRYRNEAADGPFIGASNSAVFRTVNLAGLEDGSLHRIAYTNSASANGVIATWLNGQRLSTDLSDGNLVRAGSIMGLGSSLAAPIWAPMHIREVIIYPERKDDAWLNANWLCDGCRPQ